MFNALFAVQTVLDLTYLWGGVALPDGMTYATYAHRGAYPLIVTALLAAGFVLVDDAAGQRHGALAAVPPAGVSVDRAERAAGDLVDPAARSLRRGLLR